MLCSRESKIKIFLNDFWIYMGLIPFLYPRGFSEYFGVYKNVFTGWMYLTIIAIGFIFLYQICCNPIKFNSCLCMVIVYHVYLFFVTFFLQGGIDEGLQKIFATPALCLVCIIFLQKDMQRFIECLANILIVNFSLTIFVFNPIFASDYFSVASNLMFIGHVQVAAQLGILGLFVAYILNKKEERKKGLILGGLSVLIMIISFTSASMICLLIMIIGIAAIKFFKIGRLFELDSRIYATGIIILNILFYIMLYFNGWSLGKFGINTTLNGRFTIWDTIVQLLKDHFIFGYGAFGVRIKVHWSAWAGQPEGMTYAHSQIMQLLLDGGVCLFLIFIVMLFVYISKVKTASNRALVRFCNICLLSILMVMVTESVTEYYYVFIFLSLLAFSPKISKMLEKNIEEKKEE